MRHLILAVGWSNPTVVATISAVIAFVTTILSTPVRYYLDKRALVHKLRTEYEYEQRKELRALIGRYHGRLVEAADAWHHRMENLYKHESEGRLAVHGRFDRPDYYFSTTVHRFLVFTSLARCFEAEAFFIDARIAEKTDLDFVCFMRAFRWLMTDLDLIEGLEYDAWAARDHFLTDRFRVICDACIAEGVPLTLTQLEKRAGTDPVLREAMEYFDGVNASESRLRWDRLVALHLAVMAFLNAAGYEMQHSSDADLARVSGRIVHPEVRRNLLGAIEKLGLAGNPECVRLAAALAAPSDGRRSLGSVLKRGRKRPALAPR